MQRPFRRDRLDRLRQIERDHFWFAGRWALVRRLLADRALPARGRVLDAGCGTGFTLERLAAEGVRAPVGLDRRVEGLRAARREIGCPVVRADATRLPLSAGSFDVVLMLDVLEHVDDRRALAEARRVLRGEGTLVLTVPAMPWLWSYRDVDAGHLRRYTRALLRRRIRDAGLVVEAVRYYQCLLFPLVVVTRLLGRRGPAVRDAEDRPGRVVNALLTAVNRLEVRLGDVVRWPWGSSIAVVCRKG